MPLNLRGSLSPYITYIYQYLLGLCLTAVWYLVRAVRGNEGKHRPFEFAEARSLRRRQSFEIVLRSVTCPGIVFEPLSLSLTLEGGEIWEIRCQECGIQKGCSFILCQIETGSMFCFFQSLAGFGSSFTFCFYKNSLQFWWFSCFSTKMNDILQCWLIWPEIGFCFFSA